MITEIKAQRTAGLPGMVATLEPTLKHQLIFSPDAATGVSFGDGVVFARDASGALDGYMHRANYAAAKDFYGIVVRDNDKHNIPENSVDYLPGSRLVVLRRGVIWVKAGGSVAPGDPAHLITNAAAGVIGRFRKDEVDGQTIPAYSVVFRTGGLAGALVQVELNLPTNTYIPPAEE